MDCSIFKKTLNDYIKLSISLKTTDEVNDALDFLTSSIQSAALCASITKTNKFSHNKTPHHIQILLAEKRMAEPSGKNQNTPMTRLNLINSVTNLKR
jgi:hypothetical protein